MSSKPRSQTRREFIKLSTVGFAGAFFPALLSGCGREYQQIPPQRPFITPTNQFYRMSYAGVPAIDITTWALQVRGFVQAELNLTLDDLRRGPETTFVRTLSCISNEVGGNLISTAEWTGVPLRWVLGVAGLRPGAERVVFRAADGFFTSVDLLYAQHPETYLVYAMNGEPLPPVHGFPLRVLIPNRYGMKQPKWLTSIEVLKHFSENGYWELRGWSQEAFIKPTAVIEFPTANSKIAPHLDTVYGYAYCGGEAVGRVEVDLGEGWRTAKLMTAPVPGVWTFWELSGLPARAKIAARVRVVNASGEVQTASVSGFAPAGASGYHEVEFARRK